MSAKILLLVVCIFLAVVIVTGGCMMFFTDLFGWNFGNNENGGKVNATESSSSTPDYEYDEMSSETVTLMPPDEDEKIDEFFPDHMTDDLKLKLILKALDILKTLDVENPEYVNSLFSSNDEMRDELKLRLILKAISLLSDKPLTSEFAGHVVAELKLTLVLKAIYIIKEVQEELGIDNLDDLKFNLVRKALYILKVYHGDFVDTVFKTKNRYHLQLKLTLLYLSLSKTTKTPSSHDHDHHHRHRHARDVMGNFWPISGDEVEGDSQSNPTVRVIIDNGGLAPDATQTRRHQKGGKIHDRMKKWSDFSSG